MNSTNSLLALLSALMALCAAPAYAQEESTTKVTAESQGLTFDQIRKHADLSYYGVYYGPQLGHLDSHLSDGYGRETKTDQYFLNYLGLGYKPQDDMTAGVVVMSTYTPVMGHDLTLLDPYLRFTDKDVIHTKNFNLYSELRFFLPVTRDTHLAHKGVTPGTFQAVSYRIPGSRFTLGTWAKFYWSSFDTDAKAGDDFQAYLKPQLFYAITSKLTAALYYEMQANHALRRSMTDWHAMYTDFQAGVMWDVLPGVDLNPYVQLATGGKITGDTTAVGAQIFVTML